MESQHNHYVGRDANGKVLCGRPVRECRHLTAFPGAISCPGCLRSLAERFEVQFREPELPAPMGGWHPLQAFADEEKAILFADSHSGLSIRVIDRITNRLVAA